MAFHTRAWRLLAGDDQPDKPGLPIAELLAPLPLLALGVLVINDWALKPTDLPRWLTGKLSDFAGLAVFPLVATAALDALLFLVWRLGAGVDFTLRRWKLALMIALTGGMFATMKLVPSVAAAIARALGFAFGRAGVMADPTDLVALPALAFAWWFGGRTIARGSYGRLAWAKRGKRPAVFDDVGDPELEAAARSWVDGGPIEPVRAALARRRA